MTDSATRIRDWILDIHRVGDLLGPRRGDRRHRALRMKILERPYEKLVLFRTAPAVTTGAGAGIRPEKFRHRFRASTRKNEAQNQSGREGAINCFTHNVKFVNGVAA